jgi:hypothetical protein
LDRRLGRPQSRSGCGDEEFYVAVTTIKPLHYTPWCRILFEKLIVTQLVKNIPLSYRTRKFITVFTKARHWTLS